eukprot:2981575-Pyramimonas_sp.AAC.1
MCPSTLAVMKKSVEATTCAHQSHRVGDLSSYKSPPENPTEVWLSDVQILFVGYWVATSFDRCITAYKFKAPLRIHEM